MRLLLNAWLIISQSAKLFLMDGFAQEQKGEPMSDLIDRQAAIDIERNATVDTNPSHFEAHQKFTQFMMDDAEISSFGRWQWSNGFNTALTAVGIALKKLPSAQPERWIPCSERLPEYGEDVLITDECGVYIARCYNFSRNREEPQASWWYGDANEYRTHPLAWLPLPEPYKGEQE